MAVLRIDAVVVAAVSFGQFFERRPRFVVLEVQEAPRCQKQRIRRPEALAEVELQAVPAEVVQRKAADFAVRVEVDEAIVDPLDKESVDAGKGRGLQEEFQRQAGQDLTGAELGRGLSREGVVTVLIEDVVHHVVQEDVAVVDAAADAVLGVELPSLRQAVQVVPEGRHGEEGQKKAVEAGLRCFVAEAFLTKGPKSPFYAVFTDLLPLPVHGFVAVAEKAVEEVVDRRVAGLDEGAEDDAVKGLRFGGVPVDLLCAFQKVFTPFGGGCPRLDGRAAAGAEEEGFQGFYGRPQARRHMGVGHEV